MHRRTRPSAPVGLYDPTYEHDACGVAFVARLDGVPSHETVQRAIVALENLEHRGAAGADPNTGDGAGILLQLPDEFFRTVIGDHKLPPAGQWDSVGIGRDCRAVAVIHHPGHDQVARLAGLGH